MNPKSTINKMKFQNKISYIGITIIVIVFLALLLMLIKYLETLYINEYIYINNPFDLKVANIISPFLGILLTSLFSIVTSFFLYINYIELVKTNSMNKEKQEKELSYKIKSLYFDEIQSSYLDLLKKGIFNEPNGETIHYFNTPNHINSLSNIIENNIMVLRHIPDMIEMHNENILKHLQKLEFLSVIILNSEIHMQIIEKLIKSKFIAQTEKILIYLSIYRDGENHFGDSIIELYYKWGGKTGDSLDRIEL